jgi:2-oxoglutarate ferredoxin oxidoreductase subunit alpha
MHRIGGLEKADGSGNVSYDPANHEQMIRLRAAKIAGIAKDIPEIEIDDPDGLGGADLLVVGWGSTYGVIQAALQAVRARGHRVAHAHVEYLNPFPSNLGELVHAYPKVLVPEMNLGQLVKLLRADFLVDAKGVNKVMGLPFKAAEIDAAIIDQLKGNA